MRDRKKAEIMIWTILYYTTEFFNQHFFITTFLSLWLYWWTIRSLAKEDNEDIGWTTPYILFLAVSVSILYLLA